MAYFTQIKGITNTVGTYTLDSAGNYKDTYPVSGSVAVSGLTGSIGATILNGEGVARDSWLVSDITNSIKATLVDSSGIAYSGSNPQRHIIVDTTGAEMDLFKQGDNFAAGSDHGLMILGLTDGTPQKYRPIAMHEQGSDAENNVNDRVLVESYSDVYDPYADSWNRMRGNQGYSGPGVLRVVHATDVGTSVNIIGSLGTTAAYLINAEGLYRDTMPVQGSVSVSGITGSIGATILNGEGIARDSWLVSGVTNSIQATVVDSSGIGYSGSNPLPITIISTPAGGATGSLGVAVLDSGGIAYSGTNAFPIYFAKAATVTQQVNIADSSGIGYSGSNPMPITIISTPAGGATGSLGVALVDSGAIAYSGSNPVPVLLVANTTSSTQVSGAIAENAAGDGQRPIQVGGIARTTNPGARTDGYVTSFSADDMGRQVTRPVQMRDLIATAYASYSTGTEATLLAAVAGKYHDLIYVLASNNSTASVGVDIRAVTAGNILLHLEIPANSTTGLSLPVPMFGASGDASGNAWTVDLPDITGTTVYVSALFSQEI